MRTIIALHALYCHLWWLDVVKVDGQIQSVLIGCVCVAVTLILYWIMHCDT